MVGISFCKVVMVFKDRILVGGRILFASNAGAITCCEVILDGNRPRLYFFRSSC